jgi:hypothetical protein
MVRQAVQAALRSTLRRQLPSRITARFLAAAAVVAAGRVFGTPTEEPVIWVAAAAVAALV